MSTLRENYDEAQVYADRGTIEVGDTGTICETSLGESGKPRYKNIMHLWEFLLELLADERCNSLIAWSRKTHGEFKIKNPKQVANRWGSLKQKESMNYEKLSRSLRHYYKQGIIQKVKGQRLVYKFHKLPYQYTPRKTESPNYSRILSTNSKRQGGYNFFKDYLSATDRNLDKSEQTPTIDKEKMKKIFQERVNARKNLNKSIHCTEREDEDVPSTTPSPQVSITSPLPQVLCKLHIPIPISPSACTREEGTQEVKQQSTCTCGFVVQVDRKLIYTVQEDGELPSTTPSPQSSTTSPLPQVYPSKVIRPIPIRPPVCTRGYELQVVKRPTCEMLFPVVPTDRQQDPVSYGLSYGVTSVPVSVIRKFQSAQTHQTNMQEC